MINKIVGTVEEAVAGVPDGATVMISGFGGAGQPAELIDALIDQGAKDLTIVNNNAGNGEIGPGGAAQGAARAQDHLLVPAPGGLAGVRLPCTAPARSSWSWCRRATWPSAFAPPAPASALSSRRPATPRSSRRERRRASSTGAATCSSIRSSPTSRWSRPIEGDRWGNLVYRKTARNFGPIMASAAKCTVVQVREIVALGELDPEAVVTPGIFVHRVVQVAGAPAARAAAA